MSSNNEIDQLPPAMPLSTLIIMLLAVALGAVAAAIVLPNWLPGLSQSLLGAEPKAYWYLSRTSALVAYALLWLSMALGLIITNKLARVWPGGPTAFDLHQFASLLGLAFALFHALILMGDKYINYDLAQVLVPFNSGGYKPVWVGLGQIGFYLFAIVGLSFYVRKRLGQRRWRLIHFLRVRMFYWTTGAVLVFLTVYRILATKFAPKKQARTT
jgi:predicted ferric reductase